MSCQKKARYFFQCIKNPSFQGTITNMLLWSSACKLKTLVNWYFNFHAHITKMLFLIESKVPNFA